VALDPAYAMDALRAAVGPDVVTEIADPVAHVVVRSADDGMATTLLMPVRLD
jgi:DNA polymerase III sliding clamp (beta) subunit (PCNA family)